MARGAPKDISVEEFDAWRSAKDKTAAVADAADEAGGPRLSMVPVVDRNEPWPIHLSP